MLLLLSAILEDVYKRQVEQLGRYRMERFELIAPCHFGLEAVMKREILDLGYEVSQVEDGRVTFIGDAEAVCRANIFLRTTERILLKVGSFKAETFEELFQGTRAIPWAVSYTHLDVYKRQLLPGAGAAGGEAGKPVYRGLAEDHNLPPGMHL